MPKQTFETIKIGVCDCFWRPTPTEAIPTPDEIYLGLTKGGVELTYTPEWHEITVDQFGNSVTESVLIGEQVQVNVPLAETDLDKLSMFSHTATKVSASEVQTGTVQIETTTVSGSVSLAGNAEVIVTSKDLVDSTKTILVAVEESDEAITVAEKIRQSLTTDPDISELFTVSGEDSNIILTKKLVGETDELLNISIDNGDCEGLDKIAISANTQSGSPTITQTKEKLTFGRKPGYRLEGLAGRIRLHPIALGNSNEEDVIIYKAVNKAPLQLNYKLDEERIYSTEFHGIVERQSAEDEIQGVDGSFLWQIGDPSV